MSYKSNFQLLDVKAVPLPGACIDDCKKEASAFAKGFKCNFVFNHNGVDYLADEDGNVAKLTNNMQRILKLSKNG